ncbi:CRISPR-associated helicase Cas3' [Kitasatospora phosalacinea]|uniref:CRISPR-associated helicase Cas3' n=1 Tax=Kitasatospora phosalacinea TaxID=2065 RepID=UPI003655F26C
MEGRCAPVDRRLWGKQRGLSRAYPVVCHLLDTAAVAGALWDGVLSGAVRGRVAASLGVDGEGARRLVMLWAGLHDVGKIVPGFQGVSKAAAAPLADDPLFAEAGSRGWLAHEVATHWGLVEVFEAWGYPQGSRGRMRASAAHQVAQLLGGHHGCFGAVLQRKEVDHASSYQPGLGSAEGWRRQRVAHAEAVRRVVGASAVPGEGLPGWVAVLIAGLVVVSDWLASQVELIEPRIPAAGWDATDEALRAHFAVACAAAPEWVREAGLGRAGFPERAFGEMFDKFPPNSLQRDLAERLPSLVDGPGMLVVTAPTGDGKTEAALFGASVLARAAGSGGLYFALPTMATADAMYCRVAEFAGANVTGDRSLALLHAMAWLSPWYEGGAGGVRGGFASDDVVALVAGEWLRTPMRGLLAPLGAGTIDQALTGVLPVRYGFLRLFGLANKVLVVDEAHAYGPWMHSLLVRLLEWMGAMGAPVVLLSATLTGAAAGSLVAAYRRGAGAVDEVDVHPRYPGWLYVDGRTGAVSPARQVKSDRARTLAVERRLVQWDVREEGVPRVGSRREALAELVAPAVTGGGCVLVCCTTVDEAQRTYRYLQRRFPELAEREGGLRLLHSRFPAEERERISVECERAFGKPKEGEPVDVVRAGGVLVATQVVEQSLDLDFDLVVSDLAPLAQLLQRAGRGWRHERKVRPTWTDGELRLVVLEPVDAASGKLAVPGSWGQVYDPALLMRTSALLAGVDEVAVPGDVQRLVDEVYAEAFGARLEESARADFERRDAARVAAEAAEKQLARFVEVKGPFDLGGDWSRLSSTVEGAEDLLTTRLGADGARAVCVLVDAEGGASLDEAGRAPVPGWGSGSRVDREGVAALMRRSVPIPGGWVRGRTEEHTVPAAWERWAVLAGAVLLPMRRGDDGRWTCRIGGRELELSEVGISSK